MNKVYTRINWHNYPNTTTPLNETNLNKMDYALDIIDGRVIALDTGKADLGQNGLVPLFQLPANSKIVQNDTARFALDSDEVNNGFIVVVQQPTVRMYLVVDNDNLDTEAGYQAFSADANWNTLINRPTNLAYLVSDDTDLPTLSPALRQSDLKNNLITTLEGYALDARQGKVLDEKITEVNQDLAELDSYVKGNTLNALVKITTYTSSNPYTCPKDGFIMVVSASTLGALTSVFNPINQYVPFARTEPVRAGYPQTISIFVKKGMQFYVSKTTNTDGEVYFCGID